MIDVIYTPEEMDFLVRVAEPFRVNGHLYVGNYFELIDRPNFAALCARFLDAYRRADEVEAERPPQERGWIRIRKRGDAFHVQADNALPDLTCAAIMEFRHDPSEKERIPLITTIIQKSWPKEWTTEETLPGLQDQHPK
jgi:hypothetical protein